MAWIGLARPTEAELLSLAAEFDLHPLAVEDAMEAHQRPKLERYGDTLFVVLRAARYLDAPEEVDFGELHVFVGPDFVITVRHGAAPDLSAVRRRMEETPELLAARPRGGPLRDPRRGRRRLRPGRRRASRTTSTRSRPRSSAATRRSPAASTNSPARWSSSSAPPAPSSACSHGLMAGFAKYGTDEELQRYLRDVADHVTHTSERVDGFRQALTDILTVNATLVTQQQNAEMRALAEAGFEQNEEIKKISSLGGDPVCSDAGRDDLRHELRAHAGVAAGLRIPLRDRADGGGLRQFVRHFQAAGLALGPRVTLSLLRALLSHPS